VKDIQLLIRQSSYRSTDGTTASKTSLQESSWWWILVVVLEAQQPVLSRFRHHPQMVPDQSSMRQSQIRQPSQAVPRSIHAGSSPPPTNKTDEALNGSQRESVASSIVVQPSRPATAPHLTLSLRQQTRRGQIRAKEPLRLHHQLHQLPAFQVIMMVRHRRGAVQLRQEATLSPL